MRRMYCVYYFIGQLANNLSDKDKYMQVKTPHIINEMRK